MPICEALFKVNHTLSWQDVRDGAISLLIPNGLMGVSLCQHGTGRSYNAAVELTKLNVPTVCIDRGISGLKCAETYERMLAISLIQCVPHIMVFMTQAEAKDYYSVISQLGKAQFYLDWGSVYLSIKAK